MRSYAVLTIGALLGVAVARAALALDLPSPESLGLQLTQTLGTATSVQDFRTGTTTHSRFSRSGDFEQMEITTRAGRLIERQENRGSAWLIERFAPEHEILLRHPHPKLRDIDVLEHTSFGKDGKPQLTVHYLDHHKSAAEECGSGPLRQNAAEPAFMDLDWLHFESTGNDANLNLIGCEKYPGGTQGLVRDLQRALSDGLGCLALMNEARRQDLAKFISILKRREIGRRSPTISCFDGGKNMAGQGEFAEATLPGASGYPGIALNLSKFTPEYAARMPEFLFHETIHWLGYQHGEGTDVTYLTAECCMAPDTISGLKRGACELLKKNPPWTSAEYQTDFMKLLRLDERATVAATSAWESAFVSKGDTSALQASALAMIEPSPNSVSDSFEGLILLRAALANNPVAKFHGVDLFLAAILKNDPYPVRDAGSRPKREFAMLLGRMLGSTINGENMRLQRQWKELEQVRASSCQALNQDERVQLRHLGEDTATRMAVMRSALTSIQLTSWKNLCP